MEHRTRGLSRSWAAIHRHRRVAHNRMVPERTWCLVRRARFFIFAPDSQAKHACRQAEIPLSPLFKIPGPPQINGGVPFGRKNASQASASKLVNPCSSADASVGKLGDRLVVNKASAFTVLLSI